MVAEKFYVGTANKKYSCSRLTLDEKVEIIHDAVLGMDPFSAISIKYNVKPSLVSYLVGQVKHNPDYLSKLINDKKIQH